MIGELQLVFMIRDKDVGRELGVAYTPKYTGAMVKLLQLYQRENDNPIHGIVEVEPWLITIRKNPRFLSRERIYSLAHIIRGAHVIPVTLLPVQY